MSRIAATLICATLVSATASAQVRLGHHAAAPTAEAIANADRLIIARADGAEFDLTGAAENGLWRADDGRAVVIHRRGVIAGYVLDPALGLTRLRTGPNGLDVQADGEPARCGTCDCAICQQPPTIPMPASGVRGPGFTEGCDDGTVIDVIVAYTTLTRTAAGGTAQIETEIDLAIAAANDAYINSGIGTSLRLLETREVAYNEAGSFETHLDRLRNPDDGFMDEIPALRETSAADLVALFVTDNSAGDPAGLAYVLRELASTRSDLGFSVTRWNVAAPFVFPHEIGHNQGCAHEPADGGSVGLFPDSRAYRYTVPGVGGRDTIMTSVADGDSAARFSNPLVQVSGVDTGLTGVANNAATINASAPIVANYRCSIARCTTTYSVDNGVNGGGSSFVGALDIVWLNRFTVQAGAEQIVAIQVPIFTVGDGRDTTIAIWDDPNNDGNPGDATLIQSYGPVAASSGAVLFVEVDPIGVGAIGDSFFVGAAIAQLDGEIPPSRDDASPGDGQSWLIVDSTIASLADNQFLSGTSRNWTIRAFGASDIADCNANGRFDACDIADGDSLDTDQNGIPDECEMTPTCPCEFSGDSPADLTVVDLLLFLDLWFTNNPGADYNGDTTISVVDLLEYLACWFEGRDNGCP